MNVRNAAIVGLIESMVRMDQSLKDAPNVSGLVGRKA
jgi:hypothetical protein